jgi:hypothetical protein
MTLMFKVRGLFVADVVTARRFSLRLSLKELVMMNFRGGLR